MTQFSKRRNLISDLIFKKEENSVTYLENNNNPITYIKGDELVDETWKILRSQLEDQKLNIIFSDGCHHGYAITFEYQMIKKYNNSENRDLWEYDLNLSQKELRELMTNLWEINNNYAH